ncbi:MAG TPA: hypothetical protein PLE19_06380 [Planctomycetota bacterium]|nr:hypothetical protein [Planctomycetota bacterium]HRR82708.1 hypothetical protein [Planctomycetota bacterium]HRT95413.1 hypothetical protein [Planctomycetota bacterium]
MAEWRRRVLPAAVLMATAAWLEAGEAGPFQRRWVYVSETSAVIYWQLDDIRREALSYVEYGQTKDLTQKTPATTDPRWAHFHRLKGLQTGRPCYYRMVIVDAESKAETKSEVLSLETTRREGAIRIPQEVKGPPFTLDKPGATYVLTQDVTADGDVFIITGSDVTLDLDGHTVVFGNNTGEQVSGVLAKNTGKATICNGHVVQGARCKAYSTAVESRWRPEPTEIFGISTDVHLPNAYPVKFLGKATGVRVHHNLLASRVTEIESRHYPGNDLLRLDIAGGNIEVSDNLLSEGCHIGIRLAGEGPNVEVHHNDIRHHQRYVNGYALACSCPGLKVHHNRVTSAGRGAHLTAEGIEFADNYLDLVGRPDLDDMPARSRPFKTIAVELHGIKFEGDKVRNCRVTGNFCRIVQKLPDARGLYVPATPLNIACYDPNAMNEIAENTFVALTEHRKTRHGGYGDSGEWAASVYFVGMDKGPAQAGKWSAWLHDNRFISNDLFLGSQTPVNMTIRIERNTFVLATEPPPTEAHAPFWRVGPALEAVVKAGGNRFE